MTDDFLEYATALPSAEDVRERLRSQVEYYRDRNSLVQRFRQMLGGKNPVKGPEHAQYRVKVSHSYIALAAVNEKASRFMQLPRIAVIPEGIMEPERSRAADMERATNRLFEEVEIHSDGDSWSRAVLDAIWSDSGVERIERFPAGRWPALIPDDEGEDFFSRRYDEETYKGMREEYKQTLPPPFRSTYVPIENFYPIYEGSEMVEALEIERRSLRAVLSNPMFSKDVLHSFNVGTDGGLKQQVTIVHHCNKTHHSYYALVPGENGRYAPESTVFPNETDTSGIPVHLYSYEHGLGMPVYNHIGGRYGGWKGSHNRIEGVMEALLELNQDADEIMSQYLTWIRNQGWPTYVTYFDPEVRVNDGTPPPPPKISEGSSHSLWKTEKVEMLPAGTMGREARDFYDMIRRQTEMLAGSSSLYGQRQPGVETGYHESLTITQAEHLDNKIEEHLAAAAIHRAHIFYAHIRAMGEKAWVRAPVKDRGTEISRAIALDPEELLPLPHLSAKVKATRPQDFMQNVQAALQASADRRGPGTPLLSDETVRGSIMDIEDSEEEEMRIILQNTRQEALQSGVIAQKVIEAMNLKLVQQDSAQITPEMAAGVDPALAGAATQIASSGEAAGGISPGNIDAMVRGQMQTGAKPPDSTPLNGLGGGLVTGAPQPAQTMGRGNQLLQGGP